MNDLDFEDFSNRQIIGNIIDIDLNRESALTVAEFRIPECGDRERRTRRAGFVVVPVLEGKGGEFFAENWSRVVEVIARQCLMLEDFVLEPAFTSSHPLAFEQSDPAGVVPFAEIIPVQREAI